jgi:hypothetical protein
MALYAGNGASDLILLSLARKRLNPIRWIGCLACVSTCKSICSQVRNHDGAGDGARRRLLVLIFVSALVLVERLSQTIECSPQELSLLMSHQRGG